MAAFPPKDKTVDRRPSLSGVLMQDVAHGVERSRAWPRKRGKKLDPVTKDQNDLFRQYQWATKYWDPKLYIQAMNAVKGTPLLPRDIMTMIMSGRLCSIRMVDGKVWYPMAALQDVSQSLDVITQTPGRSIRRGDELWEEYNPAIGSAQWTLVHYEEILAPVASIPVVLPAGVVDVMILALDITLSGSGFRYIQLSTDGGATFYTSSGDYRFLDANGVATNNLAAFSHQSSTSAARTIGGQILDANGIDAPKQCMSILGVNPRIFVASNDPINALRLTSSVANLTGGKFYVLARGGEE